MGVRAEQPVQRLSRSRPRRAGGQPGEGDRPSSRRRSRSSPARRFRSEWATGQHSTGDAYADRVRGEPGRQPAARRSPPTRRRSRSSRAMPSRSSTWRRPGLWRAMLLEAGEWQKAGPRACQRARGVPAAVRPGARGGRDARADRRGGAAVCGSGLCGRAARRGRGRARACQRGQGAAAGRRHEAAGARPARRRAPAPR